MIGLECFFFLLVPKVVKLCDPLVLCKLVYDGEDDGFHVGFKVAVLLFAFRAREAFGKQSELFLNHGIIVAALVDLTDDFRYPFTALPA